MHPPVAPGRPDWVVIESINTDRGRSLSRAGNFFGLVARNELDRTAAEDDAAVYTDDDMPWADLPSVEVLAGDHRLTPLTESAVNHTGDFGLIDNYQLGVEASLVDLDLEAGEADVAYTVTNQGSVPSGAFTVATTVSPELRFWETGQQARALPSTDDTFTWAFDDSLQLAPGAEQTLDMTFLIGELTTKTYEVATVVSSDQGETASELVTFGIGEIGGQVSVEGEGPVVGVTVELLDVDDAVTATTQTDNEGFYTFSYLPPGNYLVRVPSPAFEADGLIGTGYDVQTNGVRRVDPAATMVVSQPIELDGSAPEGEVRVSPSSTADDASDLTVDFVAQLPQKAAWKTWRGIVPAVVFGSLLLWIVGRQVRSRRKRRR